MSAPAPSPATFVSESLDCSRAAILLRLFYDLRRASVVCVAPFYFRLFSSSICFTSSKEDFRPIFFFCSHLVLSSLFFVFVSQPPKRNDCEDRSTPTGPLTLLLFSCTCSLSPFSSESTQLGRSPLIANVQSAPPYSPRAPSSSGTD